jgi:alkanesulfonate monooxygenase SsuD/methylene tetrahydromethanopterin reductase-like flavin-dependent oxidoreductase (luciferase family)
MASFDEIGIHVSTRLYSDSSTRNLVEIARLAHDTGFDRFWTNDFLQHRNPFAVLAAVASKVEMELGIAVLVPYFRNPVDVADSFATISELAAGSELSIGVARGSDVQTSRQVRVIDPIEMVRETIVFLRTILSGRETAFDDFPELAAYFNMKRGGGTSLGFSPSVPAKFYCGGNGPRILRATAPLTDGIIFGGQLIPLVRLDKVRDLLAIRSSGAAGSNHRIALIPVSISSDRKAARNLTRTNVAGNMVALNKIGVSTEEFERLGIEAPSLRRLLEAEKSGAPSSRVIEFVTDSMIDAAVIAGDAETCRTRIAELCDALKKTGFDRIALSKLGPNPLESTKMIAEKILPAI